MTKPNQKFCRAKHKHAAAAGCTLLVGHTGDHLTATKGAFGPKAQTWTDEKSRVNEWPLCGERCPSEPEWRCARPDEHDGPHGAITKTTTGIETWSEVMEWNDGDRRLHPTRSRDVVACLHDGAPREDTGEDGRTWASPSAKLVTPTPKGTKPAPSKNQKAPPMMKPAKVPPAKKPEPEPAPNARILGFKVHPVAAKYPLIEGSDFVEFCEDIKANGQRDKIVLVDIGKETYILDGRNRGRACEILKIKPRFENYSGPTDEASLKAFAISKNDHRRHYSKGVRAMIAADLATLGRGNPQTGKSAGLVTQAEAAKIEHVSERLVRLATAVKSKGSDKLREAVMRDKISLDAAADAALKLPVAKQNEIAEKALSKGDDAAGVRRGHIRAIVKQAEKRAVVAKINKQQVRPMPVGPFRLILIDPPWLYENSDQHAGSRGHMDYPGMPMEDICRLGDDINKAAHDDLILAMWVTNAFVWAVGRVLTAWGFNVEAGEQRTMFTWDKCTVNDKDKAGVGSWGRGRTEHLVIASRGNTVHTLNEIETLIRAQLREAGRKPDVIAELLEKHCPGPHLEMFAREERPNWAVWGAETGKFKKAA